MKRQKDISAIDEKIISAYAKGMTTRLISEVIEAILILYIDAVHFSVKDNNVIKKPAAYAIPGISREEKKY